MSIIAIIPARGGSKGIPRKNIKNFCGIPLIGWTIKAALSAKNIDQVIVSTEDKEIAEISMNLGAEVPFLRPKDLSGDNISMAPVITNILDWLKNKNTDVDAIVVLQPTSPLRQPYHIDEAIKIFKKNNAMSVISVVDVPHHFNPYSIMKKEDGKIKPFMETKNITRRQDKPKFLARNGPAVLVIKPEAVKIGNLYASPCFGYHMNRWYSVDIDEPDDFTLAELIMKNIINAGENVDY